MRRIELLATVTLALSLVAACGGSAAVATQAPSTGQPVGSGPPAGSTAPPFVTPANAVNVAVELDSTKTVAALIPVEGGSVSATGADGSVYTLDIPSDALLNETTISLTPVTSLTGMPFGGGSTYAVQLGPDGLFMQNYAILTIAPAVPIAVDQQIMFGYLRNGEDVILAPPVIDSSEIKINVLHFSGAGVTSGTIDTAREQLGATAERQLQDAIAETIGFERQHQLLCGSCPPTVDMIAITTAMLKVYHEQVVKPRVDAAGDSCEAGKLAVRTVIGVQRQAELIGIQDGPKYPGLYDKVARVCVLEEFEACVEDHRIFLMLSVYHGMVRQQQLAPVFSAGTMSEARDLTIKCMTFRLEFESIAGDHGNGAYEYEAAVKAEVVLRYNPDTGLIGGHALYVETAYDLHLPACKPTTNVGSGGTFSVIGLLYHIEDGAPDENGGYPNARVTDLTLVYYPDNSTESASFLCPGMGPVPIQFPLPAWSLAFLAAHVVADKEWAGPGIAAVGWDVKGGALYATKEWDLSLGTMSDDGFFTLHHEPGA